MKNITGKHYRINFEKETLIKNINIDFAKIFENDPILRALKEPVISYDDEKGVSKFVLLKVMNGKFKNSLVMLPYEAVRPSIGLDIILGVIFNLFYISIMITFILFSLDIKFGLPAMGNFTNFVLCIIELLIAKKLAYK